jgi:hypothetical protein
MPRHSNTRPSRRRRRRHTPPQHAFEQRILRGVEPREYRTRGFTRSATGPELSERAEDQIQQQLRFHLRPAPSLLQFHKIASH